MEEDLKKILEKYKAEDELTTDMAIEAILALFTTKMEEIIGEDDLATSEHGMEHEAVVKELNYLRKEQRNRLSKLLEGENT